MEVDKTGLKKAILKYKNQNLEGVSRDKIKSDLKDIFSEYRVDATNFFTISSDMKTGTSFSNYLDKLTDVIYQGAQTKTQDQNPEDNQESKSNQGTPKHKNYTVKYTELQSWSEGEIKPRITDKMLSAGYTMEELNNPSYTKFFLTTSQVSDMEVNIQPGKPLIDQHVDFVLQLKHALENNQSLEEYIKSKNDKDTPKDQQQSEELGQTDNFSEHMENDELTTEDLDDIMKYGIEGITTHSKMVEFRNSEEWKQIEAMQENALSRYDG